MPNDPSNDPVIHIPLSSKVRIHIAYEPELLVPKLIEEEVEALWEKARKRQDLFNAPLFCLTSHDQERIFGRFAEYRYFIASQQSQELRDVLGIYPLSVSGVVFCKDQVLVGTRDAKLALYPGYLELVPSGSIETRACQHGEVDFFMQFMWELEEEAHIFEKKVAEIRPIGLFYSSDIGVYDLVVRAECILDEYEMADLEGTQEYPLLRWMSRAQWQQELDAPDAKIVPLSRAIWKHCLQSQ